MQRRSFLKHAIAAQAIAAAPLFTTLAQAAPPQKKSSAPKAPASAKPTLILNVRDYGAIGDGTTKDTLALQQTIERCSLFGGGTVLVPAGNYLTGALALRSNVTLHLEQDAALLGSPDMADYPLAQVRWEGRFIKGYIGLLSAQDADNIALLGPGKLIGSPAVKGRVDRKTLLRLPALIEFTNCRNILVQDCYTQNYGMWSIHPTFCENITFKNVIVNSGADGIDIDSCKHVLIEGCDFDTADDCISLKSGRGAEAYSLLRTTEDVRIANCSFKDANWACIGIGSETSGGIRNVHVEHCKCLSAKTFAIYIKSRPGRGAFIEDITMNDLEVSNAQLGFLRFNILNSGKQDEFPVPGDEGIPTIKNFHFSNIRVHNVPTLVDGVSIHPHKPLEGFSLTNVTGTCVKGILLANIKNAVLKNIEVSGFTGPLLTITNVTGTGLTGATTAPAAKLPDEVPTPPQPYKLH